MTKQRIVAPEEGYAGEDLDAQRKLALEGLRAAPGQVWRSIRLVPLIREHVREDLRIQLTQYDASYKQVVTKGREDKPRQVYTSYIPHGLIVSHGDTAAEAHVSWRSTLGKQTKRGGVYCKSNRLHRMVKRIGPKSVRMLPMHMALEGFLALHFGGPDIAHEYYSKRSLRYGLTPRVEYGLTGVAIPALGHALSRFEMHAGQCGVLIYVGDALASAFVVSHPEDYRRLHWSVLSDMYAEIFWYYGLYSQGISPFEFELDAQEVHDLASLRAEFARAREQLARFESEVMAADLIEREVRVEKMYGMKQFELQRFMTDFAELDEPVNHIGERIVREDGTLEYLKTFRLSDRQVRKARLLDLLARCQWDLHEAASVSGMPMWRLKEEIIQTGFGYVLKHGPNTQI